jgi:hypothetical protein
MSPRTLHYLLVRAPADAKPLDRTLFKIRRFLEHARAVEKRRRARRRNQSRAAAAAATSASV